jgi:hypothetical protein
VGTSQAHDRSRCTAMSTRHCGCDWCCCMQGNCTGAPPSAASLGLSGAPLLPLLPYQCLLVADAQLLGMDSQLWLDGLYVRYRSTGRLMVGHRGTSGFWRTAGYYSFIKIHNLGSLWMTAVTLQGDGDGIFDCESCGLLTLGKVYAEGALLVCHNAWCSSCAPIGAPQHLLPCHRACTLHALVQGRCPASQSLHHTSVQA